MKTKAAVPQPAAVADVAQRWSRQICASPEEMQPYLSYLYQTLPIADCLEQPFSYFYKVVRHALYLRDNFHRVAALDDAVFKAYILCPRINNEELSYYHTTFFNEIYPRIQGLELEPAIQEVNRWAAENTGYETQDARTASALTVYENGGGRCGEESTFLVAALRSVGIPARQVYVPRWSHCDDNHAWTEILCRGEWFFTGACEPQTRLNLGWFNRAASRAMLVHSRLFGPEQTGFDGLPIGSEAGQYFYNQLPRYADSRYWRLTVQKSGKPAAGALADIRLLNFAHETTVARLRCDENGQIAIHLGRGSFRLRVCWQDLITERLVDVTEEPQLLLELDQAALLQTSPDKAADSADPAKLQQQQFLVKAPEDCGRNVVIQDQQETNEAEQLLQQTQERRQQRLATLRDFAVPDDPLYLPVRELLLAARSHAGVIAAFWAEHQSNPWALRLLLSLRHKDLRDITPEALHDHLLAAAAWRGKQPSRDHWEKDTPAQCRFTQYVLCPWVAYENIRPWRSLIQASLPPAWARLARRDPAQIWRLLKQEIRLDPAARAMQNLYFTPDLAWRYKLADSKSLDILFVAVLRCLGVPARLASSDAVPEFWLRGQWQRAERDLSTRLTLVFPAETSTAFSQPAYGQNWSITRLGCDSSDWPVNLLPQLEAASQAQSSRGSRQTARARSSTASLQLPLPAADPRLEALSRTPDQNWPKQKASEQIELRPPEGRYRLLCLRRVNGGDLLVRQTDFSLQAGEHLTLQLEFPSSWEENACLAQRAQPHPRFQLPEFDAINEAGEVRVSRDVFDGRYQLFVWLDPGSEPSIHLLNELGQDQELAAESLLGPGPDSLAIHWLLRQRDDMDNPKFRALLAKSHSSQVYLGSGEAYSRRLEQVIRQAVAQPDGVEQPYHLQGQRPLVLLCNPSGECIDWLAGYNIGTVARLRQDLAREAERDWPGC